MKSNKRLLPIIFFLLSIFLLSGCSLATDKSKVDLTEKSKIYAKDVEIAPEYAQLHDGYLEVALKWNFGSDEDSMKRKSFLTSGVSFTAFQGNDILIFDPEKSHALGYDSYEKSDSSVYLAFKLEDKETPVDLKFYESTRDFKNASIDLTVDIAGLESSK